MDARIVKQLQALYMADNYTVAESPLTSPQATYDLVKWMAVLPQEHMRVILLDTRLRVLSMLCVAIGDLNATRITLREVFRPAVRVGAFGLILVHNHPSGEPTPSREDLEFTRRAIVGGDLLGIEVVDHLVIGRDRYVSLKEQHGELWRPVSESEREEVVQ